MTPNQSHVAGLELALSKVDPWSDRAVWLRDLIDQAKSAPAEPVSLGAVAKVSVWQIDPWYAREPSQAGRNIGVKFLGDHAKTLVDGQPLYTHPADQVAEITKLRELLTAWRRMFDGGICSGALGTLCDQTDAALAKPST